MATIGFVVNPIAGMGGSVGLKGTDGLAEEAKRLGAKPVALERAKAAIRDLREKDVLFLTCSGNMGENALKGTALSYAVVYSTPEETTAEDTKKACGIFIEKGVDLILFCGGDGTAADVYSKVNGKVPVLGIPAGVKMHSAVFSVNLNAVAEVVTAFIQHRAHTKESEVLDVDEEAYRKGRLDVKIIGYMKVPYLKEKIQGRKEVYESETDEESKENIAKFASEFMRDGSLYIIGPGTTTKRILYSMNLSGSLLGVDLVKDSKLVASDANEKQILDALKKEKKAKIIVSPIGFQGFIFGRGNQQISAEVIRKVGTENIIIVATPHKLSETPKLRVDTGDAELDKKLSGFRQVICGYRIAQRKKVEAT